MIVRRRVKMGKMKFGCPCSPLFSTGVKMLIQVDLLEARGMEVLFMRPAFALLFYLRRLGCWECLSFSLSFDLDLDSLFGWETLSLNGQNCDGV